MRERESKKRRVVAMAALSAAGWLIACPVKAQQVEAGAMDAAPVGNTAPTVDSRWFVRAGLIGALYESHATIATGGQVIPGATAHARDNITAIFDVGYNVTKEFAVVMMIGIPPRTAVEGQGTVAPLGTLGAVRFGPVFLTGIYRLPEWGAFRSYVGAGLAHAFILEDYDGSVKQLDVHGNSGFTLQAGIEYSLGKSWGVFVDYKRLWLSLDADGLIGTVPVTARITLDPNLVSAGVRYQF
jgi:outer membrane protein